MAEVKQNEITFSNFTFGIDKPGKFGNTNETDYEFTGEFQPFVNAVEIDWNGAELGQYIINTTGQLMSYMSNISQKIENLENILINL